MGILDILSVLLITSGLIFFLGAAVGLLRFPDFYTRMHAAGKGDTLSTLLIMAGLGVYEFNQYDPAHGVTISVILTVIKIMGIGFIIMLTSPTSTHALMQAGYDDNIEPVGESEEMLLALPALGRSNNDSEEKIVTTKTTAKKKAPRRKRD
jgi:multicomponent Na+:H+ antiporter subunit G